MFVLECVCALQLLTSSVYHILRRKIKQSTFGKARLFVISAFTLHVTFDTIEKKTQVHTRSDLKHKKKKLFLRNKAINRFKFTAISNMNYIFKLENDLKN